MKAMESLLAFACSWAWGRCRCRCSLGLRSHLQAKKDEKETAECGKKTNRRGAESNLCKYACVEDHENGLSKTFPVLSRKFNF